MNQDDSTILPQNIDPILAVLEETIDKPSLAVPTWFAVGNVLFGLLAIVVTSFFIMPNLRGGDWCMVAVIGYFLASLFVLAMHLLGVGSKRSNFPRTVRFENGQVKVLQPNGGLLFWLHNGYWFEAMSYCDSVWLSLKAKPCLILRERNSGNFVACGITKERRDSWITLLRQADIPEARPLTWARPIVTIVGTLLGFLLACIITSYLGDFKIPKHQAAAIQWYCWLHLPILCGLFGSVFAGNDWFQFNGIQPLVLMFEIFSSLGIFPALSFVGKANFLYAIGLALLNGLIGAGVAYYLARLGEKRRKAFFLKRDQRPEPIGNFK